MKQALISPNEAPIKYVSGWTTDNPPEPIISNIPNSCRVAEVESQPFEVAPPLFWTECSDDVVEDQWYYDTENQTINIIPSPPLLSELSGDINNPPETNINVTQTLS
jgi:hypothetical protein